MLMDIYDMAYLWMWLYMYALWCRIWYSYGCPYWMMLYDMLYAYEYAYGYLCFYGMYAYDVWTHSCMMQHMYVEWSLMNRWNLKWTLNAHTQ